MRRTIVAGFIALGLLPAPSAGAQTVIVPVSPPVVLEPSLLGTVRQFRHEGSGAVWGCLRSLGTQVLRNLEARTGGTEVAVGVSRLHDPGTAPFPCPETANTYFTGRVRYTLPHGTNRRLLSARLQFTEVDREAELARPARCNSVVGAIGPMVEPWMPGLTSGREREGVPVATIIPQPARSVGIRSVDVTDFVHSWFMSRTRNHGLALIGVQDRVRDRNMSCAAFLRNIRLIIRWQGGCPAGTIRGGRACFSFSGS